MKHNASSFKMVPDNVRSVAKQVSVFLKSKGVPHAIIGGIAVSTYSPPRTTEDVDFMIPEYSSDVIYELDPAPTVIRRLISCFFRMIFRKRYFPSGRVLTEYPYFQRTPSFCLK